MTSTKKTLPGKTVERLSLYRRTLLNRVSKEYIYSHELAELLHLTPVQVRRDFMLIEYTGNSGKGYYVKDLINTISKIIDPPETRYAAVVGMGNLGRAISRHLANKRENIKVLASFDIDEEKISRCSAGVRCYHLNDFENIVQQFEITVGIITTPAEAANAIKNLMISSGIKGILNLTSTPLDVPENIHLEEYDIVTSLEKITYFTKFL